MVPFIGWTSASELVYQIGSLRGDIERGVEDNRIMAVSLDTSGATPTMSRPRLVVRLTLFAIA